MSAAFVRGLEVSDFAAWKDLWEQYLVFYATTPREVHTAALWGRLLNPDDPVEGLVTESDGVVVGFVHCLPHADTWGAQPVCYLQDLFVEPGHRRRGVARMLIRSVAERAREQGWSRVYWHTAEDNHHARSLYDDLSGGYSGFIVYELDLESP